MGKVRGTFEEFTGHMRIAEEPTDCSATATISMSSVNTANRMRDSSSAPGVGDLPGRGTSLEPISSSASNGQRLSDR